jgi:Kef-type K+ transport system membrane component KefB
MKLWEIWLSHISTFVVTVSGVAYLWMKYMMGTDDPFSLVNHPWQPTMLSLHVLAAPFLVFVVGLMVQSHIQKKLRASSKANRGTGLLSMIALPVMIISGYALQVVTAPWLSSLTLIMHLTSASVFAITYITHQVVSYRLSRRRALAEDSGVFARKQVA